MPRAFAIMYFTGHQGFPVPRFLGKMDFDSALHFPIGIASVCRNARFTMEGVATRYGLKNTMQTPNKTEKILGLGMLNWIGEADADTPLVWSDTGVLLKESPVGSGTLVAVNPNAALAAPSAGSYAQFAFAYNSAFMAFTDLKKGLSYPAVYHAPTATFDPVSCRPVGEAFVANGDYVVGNVVSPVTANGHLYRVTVAGIAGAEPVWPTGAGNTVTSGAVTFQEVTPSATNSGTVGNICTGLRYFVVLFRMRSGETVASTNGYISGYADAAIMSVNDGASSQQITVSNIPVGPSNCVQRIVAFGMAADPAGPNGKLVYIPEDDNTGVAITKTVIDDNVTTSATFNFDDTYLGQLQGGDTDVSDWFLKLRVPQCRDVSYLPTLDAVAYTCADGYESDVLITPRADPETVFATKSNVTIAAQDGDRTVCTRELPGGLIACWKDNSVHQINADSTNDPSGWNTVVRSPRSGACGPRAVWIGVQFAIWAHRTGIWKWDFASNQIDLVSDEANKGWSQINWAAQETIWVLVDEEAREVHIGVPWGSSTVANKTFKVDYRMGWQQGVYITMFGKLAPAHEARKWSYVNDIAATCAVIARRTLVTPVDSRINYRQILYASSAADGTVRMEVPDQYHDEDKNGAAVAIDHRLAPCFAQGPKQEVLRLIGGSFSVTGGGQFYVKPISENDDAETDGAVTEADFHVYDLDGKVDHIADGARMSLNPYFSYLMTNGNVADNWFEIIGQTTYADIAYSGERG